MIKSHVRLRSALMNMRLAHLGETYPRGCTTLLPSLKGIWRRRAGNVDKALTQIRLCHELAALDNDSSRINAEDLFFCVESFVYPGAVTGRGKMFGNC